MVNRQAKCRRSAHPDQVQHVTRRRLQRRQVPRDPQFISDAEGRIAISIEPQDAVRRGPDRERDRTVGCGHAGKAARRAVLLQPEPEFRRIDFPRGPEHPEGRVSAGLIDYPEVDNHPRGWAGNQARHHDVQDRREDDRHEDEQDDDEDDDERDVVAFRRGLVVRIREVGGTVRRRRRGAATSA